MDEILCVPSRRQYVVMESDYGVRQENLGSIPYSHTHLCSESYFLNCKMVMLIVYLKALS